MYIYMHYLVQIVNNVVVFVFQLFVSSALPQCVVVFCHISTSCSVLQCSPPLSLSLWIHSILIPQCNEYIYTNVCCCTTLNLPPPRPGSHNNTATFSISSSPCADYSSSPRHQAWLWCWCHCCWQHLLWYSGYGWWSCLQEWQYCVLRNASVTQEDTTSNATVHH